MSNVKRSIWPIPGLGLRTIKTAIAVSLCLVIAIFLNSTGILYPYYTAAVPFIACTSAIICMQDTVESSVTFGLYRLFGTGVGALIGLLFLSLDLHVYIQPILCFIGIMLCIFICNITKLRQTSVICCAVFVVILLADTDVSPLLSAVNRVAETVVGIVISVGINTLIPYRNFMNPLNKEKITDIEKIRFFDEYVNKYPREAERKFIEFEKIIHENISDEAAETFAEEDEIIITGETEETVCSGTEDGRIK